MDQSLSGLIQVQTIRVSTGRRILNSPPTLNTFALNFAVVWFFALPFASLMVNMLDAPYGRKGTPNVNANIKTRSGRNGYRGLPRNGKSVINTLSLATLSLTPGPINAPNESSITSRARVRPPQPAAPSSIAR